MEQTTQDLFDSFTSVLEETIRLIGDIAQVETDKAEAASLRQASSPRRVHPDRAGADPKAERP